MREFRLLAALLVGMALIMSGCARFHYDQPKEPRTLHSSLDATAQVYSDPAAASAVDDHPLRWLAFVLHPFGVLVDQAINRPFYRLSAQSPATSGYTEEEAQLDLQRYPLTHGRRSTAPSRTEATY